ncbi:ABC transporter permease [Bacillus sp. PS06]|uniref:ABC transporter permease n=1 Tax=Bacillus sp. PS06 TaxID=2764176 RepID=UPI00177BCEFD|nr:sugar ABC transporter permease [Bacillus sp. PS06]MBD8067839.1 sugar ABC transporter permease [Bacillus sp. PS06]
MNAKNDLENGTVYSNTVIEKKPILGKDPNKKPVKETKGIKLWQQIKKDKYLYLLALPGLIYFLIFKYLPMWGITIAFQDFSPFIGFADSPWVAFDHFIRLFNSPDFWIIFRNTLAISLLNIVLYFPLPIILAIMLNEVRVQYFKKTIQTIVYLPHFLSWVIIVTLTFMMASKSDGIINMLLVYFNFDKVDLLTNPAVYWVVLTVQAIWKEAGWGTIIFLAAIAGVNTELYEAAKMDGANRFRQIWHVTLPAIRNVILILLILRLGSIMDTGFEQLFLMYNGAVSNVGEVFDTYVYRVGVQQGQFSYSTAVGLFKSLIGLILVVLANRTAKKFGEEGIY